MDITVAGCVACMLSKQNTVLFQQAQYGNITTFVLHHVTGTDNNEMLLYD